ncbi:MAG TPA: transcriptional regulator NrdR [Gemmataceae bacterium]|jgi:transcriptional repressor NrdR|nr:transcriptional regulator NrdR [Gemmataceae bacterium]
MKCPFCREGDFAVIDSRNQQGGFPIRRRRACDHCGRRAWTSEAIEEAPLKVIKKDNTREPFDPGKIRRGLERACYKRPVSSAQIEEIVRQVENDVYAEFFAEVPAATIGEILMPRLKQLDQVAYVRFASIYREFKDVNDFMQEVQPMLDRKKRQTKPRR